MLCDISITEGLVAYFINCVELNRIAVVVKVQHYL